MLFINPLLFLLTFFLETPKAVRSNKLLNTSFPCDPISNFISTHPQMSGDPEHFHRMLGGSVVQRLLAPLYQWGRCFGSLKSFQNRLTVRTHTNVFFWSNVHLNFVSTGQDNKFLGLENCRIFFYKDTELTSQRFFIESGPSSPQRLGSFCIADEPLKCV